MNRINAYLAGSRDGSWISFFFAHGWIWLMLAVAGVLLVGFVVVVDDVTERGEQRRLQQRTTGTLLLPDELPAQAVGSTLTKQSATARQPLP